MAYIRKQKVGEKVYYQLVEKYREGDRKKLRVVCHLGKTPFIDDALAKAREQGDEELVRQLENFSRVTKKVARGVTKKDVVEDRVTEDVGTKPERKRTRFPTLPQLSPAGNLTRGKRLLVKRIPGPASYDLLPPPGEGEEWGKRYFKRITFGLMARKIKGVDPREIAGILFPHFSHNQQINLAAATLVHRLLTERLDKSVDPGRFIDEYRASDYKSVVSQIKRRGEQNGSSKLVEADVIEIRRRHKEGQTLRSLGESFGVGKEAVWKICNFKTWKDIGLTP